MAHAHAPALALQLAGHVEEAAEIAGEERVGAGGGDIGGLLRQHLVGNLRILDADGAAEAAADLGARQLREPEPLDAREQPARLRLDAELAQPRARIVVGDGAVVAGRHGSCRGYPPGTRPAHRCASPGAARAEIAPGRRRTSRGSACGAGPRRTPRVPPRSRTPRKRPSPAAPALGHLPCRRSCRRAARSRSEDAAPRPYSPPPRGASRRRTPRSGGTDPPGR